MNVLEAIAIGWFTLGFAGVVGALLRSTIHGRALRWAVMLVFILYALAVPYPWPQRGMVWAAALAVALRAAGFPRPLPDWAGAPRFLLRYFAVAMLLIAAWAALSARADLWLALGTPAALAGLVLLARAQRVGSGRV